MIPYRIRRLLRNFFVTVMVLILVAAALLVCWLLWLGRYVVYTQDGAKLDFSLSLQYPEGVAPEDPGPVPTVDIHFNESQGGQQLPAELVRYSGYTVTAQELTEDLDTVYQQLLALPRGSTIALQVKDIQGFFYYSSALGRQSGDVDIARMDQLIEELKAKGHYLIARVPAFQDYYFFLDNERQHVPYGLAKSGGSGALWLDSAGPNYWFNPESEGCLSFLLQICTELRQKGFREVIFDDFRFPKTSNIKYDPDDQPQALNDAAATLVKTCATDSFAVSFACRDTQLQIPEGRTRLYLTGVTAAEAATVADTTAFADKSVQVGFLTDLRDTRFDAFCVLRPLSAAQE